jgi:hypothetical protein
MFTFNNNLLTYWGHPGIFVLLNVLKNPNKCNSSYLYAKCKSNKKNKSRAYSIRTGSYRCPDCTIERPRIFSPEMIPALLLVPPLHP